MAKDDKGYLIVNEEEAEIVKRIYNESLQGLGTNKIAERLNDDGILTRYNKINKGTIKVKNRYTKKVSERNKIEIKWAGNTVRGVIKIQSIKGKDILEEKYLMLLLSLILIYGKRLIITFPKQQQFR